MTIDHRSVINGPSAMMGLAMSIVNDDLLESENIQRGLAPKVVREDAPAFDGGVVTGVDVAYSSTTAYACAVTVDIETHRIRQVVHHSAECTVPYVPGHFYLREAPILLELLSRTNDTGPIIIDANGILHPRRMGMASYIGVMLGKQTIGVTKKLLLGTLAERIGNVALIDDNGENVGAALWLGEKKRPVYVSIGNRISLMTALIVVERCSMNGYPEPMRQAHLYAKRFRREHEESSE